MVFKFKIEPEVYNEVQESIDYYNKKRIGLGKNFGLKQTIHLT